MIMMKWFDFSFLSAKPGSLTQAMQLLFGEGQFDKGSDVRH